jgi:hypothetical protein
MGGEWVCDGKRIGQTVGAAVLAGAAMLSVALPTAAAPSANRRPTIRPGLFLTEYVTQAEVRDENAGFMFVRITISRVDNTGTVTRRTITRRADAPSFYEGRWACSTYSFHNASPSWYYVGKYTYVFRVRDARGLWSRRCAVTVTRGTE